MEIQFPDFSMILMLGPSGSGKTTFAQRHFIPTQVVSSDNCRDLISDDPNSRTINEETFQLVHHIARSRLRNRRLTVIDATNLHPQHRKPLIDIARENDCPVTAIVMNTPIQECLSRNDTRTDRQVPEQVIRNQHRRLRQTISQLSKEGIRRTHIIEHTEEAEETTIKRTKLRLDRQDLQGPFDIIGDVHGCYDELIDLLSELGYHVGNGVPIHNEGRTAIFLGDLVDRGPASDRVLDLVMDMTQAGSALCVAGNHENKLMRSMKGNPVKITHGLRETLDQLESRTPQFREKVLAFLSGLNEQYLLDKGRLAVAHAGILEKYQGRISGRIRDFCLYGQTTGETDEWGLPVRQDWALQYHGETVVVYGHTPVEDPHWTNETINVDTGCVFGGRLTALRYPERKLVSVPAVRTYYQPVRPDTPPPPPAETIKAPANPHTINLSDVTGKLTVHTASMGNISIGSDQTAAALETMSRYAVDPRWLIYLPPTISPCVTSDLPHVLEHPQQAFTQYRQDGLQRVICEEKHMGSRGIVVIARDRRVAKDRFGIDDPNSGACYTRTGRTFFTNPALEASFLGRTRYAVNQAGLWDQLETDWLLMDCEIMPWSLKAQGLLRNTYAPTGAAAVNTLQQAGTLLAKAAERGIDTQELKDLTLSRLTAAERYRKAYRQYCWTADSLSDIKTAPFHLLAAEGRVFSNQDHEWHMLQGQKLAQQDPGLFQETRYQTVDLADDTQEQTATEWWTNMTRDGGEGMVVKPMDFIPAGQHDHIQPAVKVRGPEYLRIIYGPEYDLPENIQRLRQRALRKKRSMALREFALGLEGLQRFVDREPLNKVHQCAFAVLALETDPIDPRL